MADSPEATRLSNVLRTVAADVALRSTESLDSKRHGDLMGRCPFHKVASIGRDGAMGLHYEDTLFVRIKEADWHCIRCNANGDAAEFTVRRDALERAKYREPTGLWASMGGSLVFHRGGPLDDLYGQPPQMSDVVPLPAWDAFHPGGRYVQRHVIGKLVVYDWEPNDAGGPELPDFDVAQITDFVPGEPEAS